MVMVNDYDNENNSRFSAGENPFKLDWCNFKWMVLHIKYCSKHSIPVHKYLSWIICSSTKSIRFGAKVLLRKEKWYGGGLH